MSECPIGPEGLNVEKMKKVDVVSEYPKGLYAARHTHYPKYDLKDFKGDIEEMYHDIPWDSDTAPGQGRDIPRYKKEEYEIPEWMDVEYFIKNFIQLRSFWSMVPKSVRKEWHGKLLNIYRQSPYRVFLLMEILQVKNFRSEFRKSLCNQIVKWLEDPSPKYEFPLSSRQLDKIDIDAMKIKFRRSGYCYR